MAVSKQNGFYLSLPHSETKEFLASAALFQCTVLAYNTVRWMALVSGDKQLMLWEIGSIGSFIVRMAGKVVCGGRQMTLKIAAELLPPKPWQSWLEILIACPQARNATIKIETTDGYDNLYADTIA